MNSMPRAAWALIVLMSGTWPAAAQQPTYPPPAEVRAAFLKLLDRPQVLFNVKNHDAQGDDGLVSETLSFASEKRADGEMERVPVLLVRPEKLKGKLPAVIVLHGTGGTKESQRAWLLHLARRGIIGVAI